MSEWKWKPIETHNQYEVSSFGEVRKIGGEALKQWPNHNGYMMVRLSNPRITERVHRLVARAFIPNPDGLPVVNHKDSNRANNDVSNLEWCTQWGNLDHASRLGRMQRNYWQGKRSPSAKLSDETAAEIRREYAKGGKSWDAIGKAYGVSKRTIGRIVRGSSYV